MSDTTAPSQPATVVPRGRPSLAWIALGLLPFLLLIAVLTLIIQTNAGLGDRATPPIEQITIQRVRLPAPGQIVVDLVNDGPDEVTVAQVLVDSAYWQHDITPGRTLGRLQSARVTIPYPWVEGEAHRIQFLTRTGVLFDAEVPVAVESPAATLDTIARFALIGFYVGVVPVALGLLWYPFLRRLGRSWLDFILALTIGLLLFLIVDAFLEAGEVAAGVAGAFAAPLLVPIVALLAWLFLVAVSGLGKPGEAERSRLSIAYRIAFAIGLHNLGEGLAIGAAFALGEIALGVFLIVGFTLHNVTEGVGIAAPILRERPALPHFVGLAVLAGAPAILGVWVGGFIYSPVWTTVFLAIGVGALAQVVVEVARILVTGSQRRGGALVTWPTLGGIAAGLAIMYATALLVAA